MQFLFQPSFLVASSSSSPFLLYFSHSFRSPLISSFNPSPFLSSLSLYSVFSAFSSLFLLFNNSFSPYKTPPLPFLSSFSPPLHILPPAYVPFVYIPPLHLFHVPFIISQGHFLTLSSLCLASLLFLNHFFLFLSPFLSRTFILCTSFHSPSTFLSSFPFPSSIPSPTSLLCSLFLFSPSPRPFRITRTRASLISFIS